MEGARAVLPEVVALVVREDRDRGGVSATNYNRQRGWIHFRGWCVTKDGLLTARSADIVWDSGAYTSNTVGVAIRGSSTMYRLSGRAFSVFSIRIGS